MSDSQVLDDLLTQIPLDERIDSVYTDGAYDTKYCRQVILDRDAHAVIPPRKNAKPWKDKKMGSLLRQTTYPSCHLNLSRYEKSLLLILCATKPLRIVLLRI